MNPIHLIIIGDELLNGKRQDRHLKTITSDLGALGQTVTTCEIIRDEEGAVADCIRRRLAPNAIVVTTGGLGPTVDDLTREGIAQATSVGLREESSLWEDLKVRFERMGRTISDSNRSQALVPERGTFFQNPHGTAPGLVFEPVDYPNAVVVALPGPPRELNPMWKDQALPYLRARYAWPVPAPRVLLRFSQLGESRIDEVMRPWLSERTDIEVSSLFRLGRVDVSLQARTRSTETLKAIREIAAKTRQAFEHYIYEYVEAVDGDDPVPRELEEVVEDLLRKRGEKVATAESCSGGLVAKCLTDIPGSSDVVAGGIVAYSNDLKVHLLNVPPRTLEEFGAVSEEVVAEMAKGALEATGADWAISVSGIAGPGGGTPEKPVGLVWIGIGNRDRVECHRTEFPGDRETVRDRSVVVSLRLLWQRLLENE